MESLSRNEVLKCRLFSSRLFFMGFGSASVSCGSESMVLKTNADPVPDTDPDPDPRPDF